VGRCSGGAFGDKEMIKAKHILIAVSILIIAWIGIRELLFLRMRPDLDTMAAQLLRTQSSENVVHIGESTRSSLKKISKQYPGATWEIRSGDAPRPLGDGSAQACIMYRDGGKELFGLRIRQDGSAFHIVGYWTPR